MNSGSDHSAAQSMCFDTRLLRARDVDLRPFKLDDINDAYCCWMHDEEVIRFTRIASYDRSIEGLRAYALRVMETPGSYFWSVVHRADQHPIGTAKLVIDLEHGIANWGYLIGEQDYWRDGLSLQVQIPVFDLAFDELGVRKLYGGTYPDHIKSRFNLARMGFQEEGRFRQHIRRGPDGAEVADLVYYGLLVEEWLQIRDKFNNLRYG